LDLVRFKSTKSENGVISLKEYVDRMKEEQKEIIYITGENEKIIRNSPLLEAYRKNDIEVLIMGDEFDEIISSSLTKYKDIDIKNIESLEAPSTVTKEKKEELENNFKDITSKIKDALGEKVKDVVVSTRLNNSASCIVADKDDPMAQMATMMKAMGQEVPKSAPILEINPEHSIIKNLSKDSDLLEDISYILLDQALLNDGKEIDSPIEFTNRVNKILAKAL
jgi:molecular chaperone HtpG